MYGHAQAFDNRIVQEQTRGCAPLVLVLLLVVASGSTVGEPAEAQEGGGYDPIGPGEMGKPDLVGRVGAAGFVAPPFEGAKNFEVAGFPALSLTFRERYFLDAQRGLGWTFLEGQRISAAVALGYYSGRDADGNNALNGLPDIAGGLDAKGFLALNLFPEVELDVAFRRGLTGDNDGTTIEFGAGHSLGLAEDWIAQLGLNTTYADGEYMDKYFSVTTPQSAASGLSAFEAEAGFKDIGLGGTVIWSFQPRWAAFAQVEAKRLLGDAADSPLVKNNGDPNQFSFGLGVTYTFTFAF